MEVGAGSRWHNTFRAAASTFAVRRRPRGDPLPRYLEVRWGETADFGGPVVFLASDASRYVHGTELVVDGGWLGR